MRYDAQHAALLLMPPKQLAHAVVGLRNVVLDIVVPIYLLALGLGAAHADDIAEKRDNAGVKVVFYILLKCVMHLGMIDTCVLDKAGVVDRGGAVDNGVVMIDHQTGISHVFLRNLIIAYIIPCFFHSRNTPLRRCDAGAIFCFELISLPSARSLRGIFQTDNR